MTTVFFHPNRKYLEDNTMMKDEHYSFSPNSRPEGDAEAEPGVVSHEDQHQEVGETHLFFSRTMTVEKREYRVGSFSDSLLIEGSSLRGLIIT